MTASDCKRNTKRWLKKFNDKKTTPERKAEIRAEMTKIAEDANRLHRKDAEFYASMSEADQSELIRLNQEISRVRKVAREPGKSEEQLKVLADEARGYMEAKLNIENQYDAAAAGFDLNPARQQQNQAEMDRIADDILGVDRQFDALGLGLPGVQYKAGKMVLTREGVEGMLSRFLAGEIKGTKFATAEQIRDGMVNAFNMAKAIVDENPDAEVVMVNSREAWNREIGSPTKISRGTRIRRWR